jgi:hypothetical protein
VKFFANDNQRLARMLPMIFGVLCTVHFASPARGVAGNCIPVAQRYTPARFPIVFHPQGSLFGKSPSRIEAWRFESGKWSQVPLQIDEVNTDGNFVLDEGIPYTKYTGDGWLGVQDDMSVNGESLGGTFTPAQVTKTLMERFVAGKSTWRVDFCGSNTGYLGSLLIGLTKVPAQSIPYTSLFSRLTAEVNTSNYRYKFRDGHPMLMGQVSLKTSTGEASVFAGSSFVMPLIPKLFFLPSFYFGEKDFTSEIECWKSGPVRSIVAVGARLTKFFSLIDLHLFSELVFYDRYFQIPTKIEFIFDPSKYMARGTGLGYVLKYPDNLDWRLSSNLESLPASGPGDGQVTHTAFDVAKDGRFAIKGESAIGSFSVNIHVDEGALKQAPPPYIVHKESFLEPGMLSKWPWLKKSIGNLGVFIEISSVQRGIYDFGLDVALSNQAHDTFTDFQTVSAQWPDPVAN